MAEGAESSLWNPFAASMALQANINRDAKKRSRPFTSAEFHPFMQAQAAVAKRQGSAEVFGALTSIAKRSRFVLRK